MALRFYSALYLLFYREVTSASSIIPSVYETTALLLQEHGSEPNRMPLQLWRWVHLCSCCFVCVCAVLAVFVGVF